MEGLLTRSDEGHSRLRESMLPDSSIVYCRGLRQRAYSRRMLCETQPVAPVRFATGKAEDHAADQRSQCGRGTGGICATSQTLTTLTFRLELGVASRSNLQA